MDIFGERYRVRMASFSSNIGDSRVDSAFKIKAKVQVHHTGTFLALERS
jgi:hypothetical protein